MFGAAPAFGTPFGRPEASSGSFHVGHDTRRGQEGWRVKVLWVLEPLSEPVTISGHEVDTGAAITFDPSNGPPSDTIRLDPRDPGTPDRRKGWTEYPSSVRFPGAGCYLIQASWTGGSWQRGFGFGR
jgi:hypothetical protein